MSINLESILNPQHDKKLVSGTVASCNADVAVIDLFGGGQGFLPITNWYAQRGLPAIGHEVTAVTLDGSATPILSATDEDVLRLLVEGLCPEAYTGDIRVMGVARIPGERSKVAVAATVEGMDPVRTVVGRSANRVAAFSEALLGERVDIVAWADSKKAFIANAMAPATVLEVKIKKDRSSALAVVDGHKVAAAVGIGGTNAALVSTLVGVDVRVIAA